MKRLSDILLVVLFIGFLCFFSIMTWLTPDKDISAVENRSLAQQPILEWGTIMNGEYMENFDSYITDQFYQRNTWIKSYLQFQIFTNQTFIYNYHIDGEWVYPKPFTTIDQKAIQFAVKNMAELNHYARNHNIELFYFSLPDRRHMIDARYPRWVAPGVGQADKERFLSLLPEEHIQIIDVGDVWNEKYGYSNYRDFYFHTDHHWNMRGAMAAYEVIQNTLHERSKNFTDGKFNPNSYEKSCLSNKNFYGIYNQQLYNMLDASKENMCYYNSKYANEIQWIVYVNGMNEDNRQPFSQVYGTAKNLDKGSVSYAEVYANDYRELHIINPDKQKDGVKVLVLKDSYANPLIPHIAEHFYQTTYYDVRHNPGKNLYDFIEQYDYDMILFLYSNGRTLEYLYDFK